MASLVFCYNFFFPYFVQFEDLIVIVIVMEQLTCLDSNESLQICGLEKRVLIGFLELMRRVGFREIWEMV